MVVIYPFRERKPARLDALVVAYVNENAPVLGQASLRAQIKAVQKRAKRDGIAIGLLVIESGGRTAVGGCGHRLDAVLAAARLDGAKRVLYVADTNHLATGPVEILAAMRAIFDANFELRAPCGRISPTGRRSRAIEQTVATRRTRMAEQIIFACLIASYHGLRLPIALTLSRPTRSAGSVS